MFNNQNAKTLLVLVFLLSIIFFGCSKYPFKRQIGKEAAAKKIVSTIVKDIWEKADKRKGLRVHQYQQLLPPGTRVQPAFAMATKEIQTLVCKNPSWLFFIDEQIMGLMMAEPALGGHVFAVCPVPEEVAVRGSRIRARDEVDDQGFSFCSLHSSRMA